MCGRTFLTNLIEELAEEFGVETLPAIPPRYNIAPGQDVLAVRVDPETGRRGFSMLRWGLVPWWARDAKSTRPLVMARAETAAKRPAFRDAFRSRRCLLPASGFYEWRRSGRTRQPFVIRMKDRRPFAIAALWDRWKTPEGSRLESCAVLTTSANEIVAPIHDRMPAILERGDFEAWLDPGREDLLELQDLLRSYPAVAMEAYPASTRVNRVEADDPSCLEPAAEAPADGKQKSLW
ncbi:MAG TPA: SOS response-associated peptidase [Vicinamibacteria bacterium]|nr:SOS response-associated peptidase [Vicinamibacteria bacterium]